MVVPTLVRTLLLGLEGGGDVGNEVFVISVNEFPSSTRESVEETVKVEVEGEGRMEVDVIANESCIGDETANEDRASWNGTRRRSIEGERVERLGRETEEVTMDGLWCGLV